MGTQLVLGPTALGWEMAAAYGVGTLIALPLVLLLVLRRPDAHVARLLAHYGVTADGRVVEPVSYWSGGLFTRWTAPLLATVLLVLAVGVTYALSSVTSSIRCQDAPRSGIIAIEAELGVMQLPGGPPVPPLFEGARLVDARRVHAGLDGVYYLAAYVDGLPGGFDTGPAVWRIIEPDRTFDLPTRDVSAVNAAARTLTPVTGASSSSPDPTLEAVLRCAEDARG